MKIQRPGIRAVIEVDLIIGFLAAALMGVWLLVAILKKGKL